MADIPSRRLIGGRYEVRSLIGRGGMAEVHLAYDTRLSRVVAIKMLLLDLARDTISQRRFRREAQSAASLNHPSIVAVYDTGEEEVVAGDGQTVRVPYLVMEYVEGHTVRELLSDGSPVPIDEAVEIVSGVLTALEYSHHRGLVHRDIKPGNVMLTNTGEVKVMDFGIARAMTDSQAGMTQTDAVVGTAQYLSPEQARGEQVDARSDLYSTGCLLFELLTGRPPFKGDSAVAVAYQHVSELPPTPSSITPDVPESLDRVVMKSLAKKREERYSDARQMLTDLRAAAHGAAVSAPATEVWKTPVAATTQVMQPSSATPPVPPPTLIAQQAAAREEDRRKRKQRKVLIWVVVLLTLAAIGVATAFAILLNQEPDAPETVMVPEGLVGLTEKQARQMLDDAGLVPILGDPQESEVIPENHVIDTDPPAGTELAKGSKVKLIISSGPGKVEVPNMEGWSQEQARDALESAGLKLGNIDTVDSPKQAKGKIIASDPEFGTEVEKGSTVNLQIASGNVSINQNELLGKPVDEVKSVLQELKVSIREVERQTSDTPPGTVYSISPSGLVAQGTQITIEVAVEPPPAPEPPQPADDDKPKCKDGQDPDKDNCKP